MQTLDVRADQLRTGDCFFQHCNCIERPKRYKRRWLRVLGVVPGLIGSTRIIVVQASDRDSGETVHIQLYAENKREVNRP